MNRKNGNSLKPLPALAYRPLLFLLLLICIATGCGISQKSDSEKLHSLFDDYWEFRLNADPYLAASYGETAANALLPDASLAALEQRNEELSRFLSRLRSLPTANLDSQDGISYRLLEHILSEQLREFELGYHFMPLNGWWDYHAVFAEQPVRMPFRNAADYENFISRLESFPELNRQYLERLRMAVEREMVRPAVVLEPYIATITALIEDAEDSRFFEPFLSFPTAVSQADKERLRLRGLEAVRDSVLPAYRELAEFMKNEYLPAAPSEIGLSNIPGGLPLYEYLVGHYTTMDVSPAEVHLAGLAEIARIREEMDDVIRDTGFRGDFAEFVEFLRTDNQFYAESPEELLRITALYLKQMDGKLPEFFGRLPRMPYGLREVPDYLAPRMTTAYYNRPASDGTRAGFYYVNTYNLPSRPLYEVEALSFHEAVPGHHLQLALQQELEGLPDFRRNSSFTVFVEGWALYAEWLALEMGFYTDPYSNFGRLTYEMWRALRLVVDTGIHAKGWTRDEAISYMAENSALSLLNIRNEVDRYIFWPGQALGYKTGEMKIKELREQAENELGSNFDIRHFHDLVLENGSITLEILEEEVLRWIQEQL
ncbi:MAG: DUF885 domain-containing protein [Balneolales bacterium]|nr:DUF885 domain-containing protein [Balneolales bacterium]